MKLFFLISSLALVSCSQMQTHVKEGSTAKAQKAMDSVDLEWDAIEKMDDQEDNTHVLVDSNASDTQIAQEVGGNPDEELDREDTSAPRPFLKKYRTKRVDYWVEYFTKSQRDRFQRFLNNAGMYRPIIEKILESEGVPKELFFVGLIESGYYLGAHSHAKAVGPWQFIRGTGLRYGLVINRELDERRDIFKATQAAAQYFKDLHNIFSSWELALAAYNAGEYGIIRRITKHKTRDYYELSRRQHLHPETINYVPKVLAAMHVVNNAEKYGFSVPDTSKFWVKTKTVSAPKGTSLKVIARKLNVTHTLLSKLNPELRGGSTPRYFPGGYELRVPASKSTEWMETFVAETPAPSTRVKEVEVLRERLENPSPAVTVATPTQTPVISRAPAKFHRVRSGETLSLLSRRHRISLGNLAKINNLRTSSKLRVGQKIKLTPQDEVGVKVAAVAKPKKTAERPLVYKLQRGETLTDVSRWFGIPVATLKVANKISKGRTLAVGHKIAIPGTKVGNYVVKRGDYLMKVAEKFNIGHKALMKLNQLKNPKLWVGQRLVVNLE